MKLEQARYIVAVYRTGSITQAAKDLYLSQPNISNSLKNLEQELGFKILTRSQKRDYRSFATVNPFWMKLITSRIFRTRVPVWNLSSFLRPNRTAKTRLFVSATSCRN